MDRIRNTLYIRYLDPDKNMYCMFKKKYICRLLSAK